jgi:hypothetical protein
MTDLHTSQDTLALVEITQTKAAHLDMVYAKAPPIPEELRAHIQKDNQALYSRAGSTQPTQDDTRVFAVSAMNEDGKRAAWHNPIAIVAADHQATNDGKHSLTLKELYPLKNEGKSAELEQIASTLLEKMAQSPSPVTTLSGHVAQQQPAIER